MMIPCKGCMDRSAECHINCKKYKEYQKVIKRVRKERIKQKQKESCSFGSVYYTMVKENLKKINKKR